MSSKLSQLSRPMSMQLAARAKDLIAKGVDVIDLTLGQPDFHVPQSVCDAIQSALDSGQTGYTAGAGVKALREKIAEHCSCKYSITITPSQVLVAPGAKQAIFYALGAAVNPGDEVLIPTPSWLSYGALVTLVGGVPRYIPLDAGNGFTPNSVNWGDWITARTRAIVINNPVNPTGRAWGRSALEAISRFAADFNLRIISDQIYDDFMFQGANDCLIPPRDPSLNRVVLIHGFSKTFAMTGLRIGYAIADPLFVEAMTCIHEQVSTCACSLSQYGAIRALGSDLREHAIAIAPEYERRFRLFTAALRRYSIPFIPSEGTFYAFVDSGRIDRSSMVAAEKLLQAGVACIPGVCYGESADGFVRVSLTQSDDRLLAAAERIGGCVLAGHKNDEGTQIESQHLG